MEQNFDLPQGDIAYRQFMEFWKSEHEREPVGNKKKFHMHTSILDELAHNNETLFLLFDRSKWEIQYFGKNMESIFGYPNEELKKLNLQLLFRALPTHHLSFPITISKWINEVYASAGEIKEINRLKFSYCGLQVKHKKGHYLSLLVQYLCIEKDAKGRSTNGIVIAEDASHLLKGNFYWARCSCSETGDFFGYINSNKKSEQKQDIISEREKEVLRLIAKGHSSKEISNLLFIAQNTVNRHRKNMIARTGAKDTTALVHICRRVGII